MINKNQRNGDNNVLFPHLVNCPHRKLPYIVFCNICVIYTDKKGVVLCDENDFSTRYSIDKIQELGRAQDHCLNLMGQQMVLGQFSWFRTRVWIFFACFTSNIFVVICNWNLWKIHNSTIHYGKKLAGIEIFTQHFDPFILFKSKFWFRQ